MKINSDVLHSGFQYVQTLVGHYQGRTNMTSDQLVGKILYDLQEKFEETPELELVSIVALASTFANQAEIVNYLKQEFLDIITYYRESDTMIQLDLPQYEAALFLLFAGSPDYFFQEPPIAV